MEVNMKCSQCGGDLVELKNVKDTYICLSCGSKKLLKGDNTLNNFGIINNINLEKVSRSIENIELLFSFKEYDKAYELAQEYIEKNASDWKVWYILCQIAIERDLDSWVDQYEGACKLISNEEDLNFINEKIVERIHKRFEVLMNLNKEKEAEKLSKKAYEIFGNNHYQVCWDLCIFNVKKCFKNNMSFDGRKDVMELKNKAISIAPVQERKKLEEEYKNYVNNFNDSRVTGIALFVLLFSFLTLIVLGLLYGTVV